MKTKLKDNIFWIIYAVLMVALLIFFALTGQVN